MLIADALRAHRARSAVLRQHWEGLARYSVSPSRIHTAEIAIDQAKTCPLVENQPEASPAPRPRKASPLDKGNLYLAQSSPRAQRNQESKFFVAIKSFQLSLKPARQVPRQHSAGAMSIL